MRGLDIPAQFLVAYFLIHFRFIGMMFLSPLFSNTAMPMPFRYLCAVMLTVAAAPTVTDVTAGHAIPMAIFDSWIAIAIVVLREFFIGAALGFLATLPITAAQAAGEKIGMSMALAMAHAVDPTTQQQTSLIAQLYLVVTLWFYFRWNGHLLMIQAVMESVRLIPLARMNLMPADDMSLAIWIGSVFVLSLRMVLPFYCAILLADVGLGFLARTVPQMNVFVLGLPLKISLGMFVIMIALPLSVDLIFSQIEPWIEFALASATAWR